MAVAAGPLSPRELEVFRHLARGRRCPLTRRKRYNSPAM